MSSTLVQRKNRSIWAWIPAMVVVAASVITAAGISLMPSATAASQTVNVDATVGASLNFSPACSAGTIAFGANFTTGGPEQVSPDCAVTFDTNNALGAKLELYDNDGVAPFFCHQANGCGGANEFANTASTFGTLATGEFGAALESKAGAGAVATWSEDASGNVVLGDASFYPIAAVSGAGTEVCRNNASTAGTTCTMSFAGEPKAVQNAGNYRGVAHFELTAL